MMVTARKMATHTRKPNMGGKVSLSLWGCLSSSGMGDYSFEVTSLGTLLQAILFPKKVQLFNQRPPPQELFVIFSMTQKSKTQRQTHFFDGYIVVIKINGLSENIVRRDLK